MKFQPGQSGNPAGRPLGARGKTTIAREEELGKRAKEAVDKIVIHAGLGNAAAIRICAEWLKPGGNSRALALELPRVTCADDAQAAFDMVIEEFGQGAITVRELPIMLGSVDRMARVAQRIDAMREKEHERYANQRVHGVHPDMIPKPTGEPDRYELIKAAMERGENPFPDDPEKFAYIMEGEELFPPVNSGGASLPRAAGESGSPEYREGEPGGGSPVISDQSTVISEEERTPDHCSLMTDHCLYSPVNFAATVAEEERSESTAEVPGFPSPHAKRGGEGLGVGGDVRSEQAIVLPCAVDAALPSPCGEVINESDALYLSVNPDQTVPSQFGGLEGHAIFAPEADAVSETLAPSPPRAQASGGEGGDPGLDPGEPGGGSFLLDSPNRECCEQTPPTPDPSPPFAARMGGGEPAGLDLTPG